MHCSGHIRETFIEAIAAFTCWKWRNGEPEPKVTFEVNYEPRQIAISEACGLVWSCTDTLPRAEFNIIAADDPAPKSQTYAAVARAMLRQIKGVKTLQARSAAA